MRQSASEREREIGREWERVGKSGTEWERVGESGRAWGTYKKDRADTSGGVDSPPEIER